MRRKGLVLFSAAFILAFSSTTFAESPAFQPLSQTEDYHEIKALEEEMLERANALYEFGKLERKMRSTDIDLNKVVKIYMDGPDSIFSHSMADQAAFLSFLENTEHIWVLQVDLGSQTVTYTFNIGRPVREEIKHLLTPEQISEMEEEEGRWKIVKVAWGDTAGEDYKHYIKRAMAQEGIDEELPVILIGGTPEIWEPLAVLYDAGEVTLIPSSETANNRLRLLLNANGAQPLSSGREIEVCSLEAFFTALE